jgi:hypothetical protein
MRCFTKQVLITFLWMKAVGHAAMDAFDSIGEERLTHARCKIGLATATTRFRDFWRQ